MNDDMGQKPPKLVDSDIVQEILQKAQHAAWERSHQRIEPLHLLYAILASDSVVTVIVQQLLEKRSMTKDDLLCDIDNELGVGSDPCRSSDIPYNSEADLVVRFAEGKALTVGVPTVFSDQLMLGIFNQGGPTVKILKDAGVTEASFKKALKVILSV